MACSTAPGLIGDRIEDWKATVAQAERHHPLPEGIRLRFPRSIDVAALARLAAEEQTCCGFLTVAIGIEADGITLDMTGLADAQPVITAMFGSGSMKRWIKTAGIALA